MKALFVTTCLVMVCGVGLAQQPGEKPKELESLGQYVGDWTTDVTDQPAALTPHEIKYRCLNHAEFVRNGWFLQHIEVKHIVGQPEKVWKAIWFQTFDTASSEYVTWFFQSSGNMGKYTGIWDAASRTFSFVLVLDYALPPDSTIKFAERFVTNGLIDGTFTCNRNDGHLFFDTVWTRKRQAGVVGKPLQEQWARIGTPIQPIPDEVKKLEAFVGPKDVEFTHRPSVVSPQGGTTKTVTSGEWILDGRFVLAHTGVGERESLFVTGYDTNKQAFRYVRMGANGELEENIGQWNEAARSFEWKGVGDANGLTRTATSRLIGNGAIETHILTKTQDGKVHMDLTMKSTPRK